VIFPGVYSVKVTGNNSCMNTDTIAVKVTPLPVFSLGNDTTLCDTKTLLYNFSLPGASYLWSDGSTGNSFVVSKPGDYSLRVTQAGCALSKMINVAYKPMPVVNLGNDTVLCRGDILTLNAFNLSANYLWQDNSKQSQFAITTDGLYDVTVNLNGCIKQDSIKVLYKDVPHFSLGNDTAICRGMEWVLSPVVDTKVSYQWQDGSTQAFYTIKDTGTYAVQVKNECGTTADEIKITAGFCKLILPSAFTPNGDGNNDLFRIKDPFYVKFYNMTVFGRWGEKVFESTDMHKGWDGTYNGVPATATTYVWVVSLIDAEGKSQSAKGTVVLIR
jgi:gliding motility-associated-like protein